MKKVKFLKTGRFAGLPHEPQISIADQDLGNYHEVSDSLAEISVNSGVAVYEPEPEPEPKKRANPAKSDKAKAERE